MPTPFRPGQPARPDPAGRLARGELQDAVFIQARLLDQFIALTREVSDGETGFTRDSLGDLMETLREQRRSVGTALRPRLVAEEWAQ
ncbi:MAG: hypothetical protein RLY86_1254 [Pseudomonadota bacterium]|jgi:hypothetical protein